MSEQEVKLFLASASLLPVAKAAEGTPYSAEYLGLLARKGRLKAVKISRDWLTTRQAVFEYLDKQAKKHRKILNTLENFQVESRSLQTATNERRLV